MRGSLSPTGLAREWGALGASHRGSGGGGRTEPGARADDGGGDDDDFLCVLLASPGGPAPQRAPSSAPQAEAEQQAAQAGERAGGSGGVDAHNARNAAACPTAAPLFRCVDAAHAPGCVACTPPPDEADTADYVLRGDKGAARVGGRRAITYAYGTRPSWTRGWRLMIVPRPGARRADARAGARTHGAGQKNGERRLRSQLCRTREWHCAESREAAAAQLVGGATHSHAAAADVSNLVNALRTRNVAIMRKADFFMLCRLWRLRSDVWRSARAEPARRVRTSGRSGGGRRAAAGAAAAAAAAGEAAAAAQHTRRRSGRRVPRGAARAAAAEPLPLVDASRPDLRGPGAGLAPLPPLFPLSAAPPSLHELWHAPHEAAPPPWHFAPPALPGAAPQAALEPNALDAAQTTGAAAAWMLSPYGGARDASLLTGGFGASTSAL
jgi:hypothetical protein